MTADITLRGPGDVLAVLPYQLGYHPRRCVLVVSLRGRSVGLVARTDLPPDDDVTAAVGPLLEPLRRDGATSVIVIGYEDESDRCEPTLLALVELLEAAAIEVVDVVVVRDGRRYSPVCSQPCCPPEGVLLPEPADVPAVAEFVVRGRSPLASRDAVEGLVAADPSLARGVADAVAARSRMPRRRRRAAVAWRLVLRHEAEQPERPGHPGDPGDPGGPGGGGARGRPGTSSRGGEGGGWRPQVVADAALGLSDIAWRDGLVAWLAPGVLPMSLVDRDVVALLHATLPTWGGMGSHHPPGEPSVDDLRGAQERRVLLHRLLDLCRAVPDDCAAEAAAVCTVTAHVAWVEGDGAVARAAVDRALRLAPDYRLALLLVRLVEAGLRLPRRDRGEDGEDLGRAG
ncbi:MAG TPA: DUF4192 family protein [Ornithinibacter sp.]|nr:DUF4192 family protein [Ornithinibacter sp.]